MGGDNHMVVDRTRSSMDYLYILGSVVAIVAGTFCFAPLQWPKLFTTAWIYQRDPLGRQHRRNSLGASLIPRRFGTGIGNLWEVVRQRG
jgi:hypothetical protein